MLNTKKPYKGYMRDAVRVNFSTGYVYNGVFDGHPRFDGRRGHTSEVIREGKIHEDGCVDVETINSRYTIELKR